MKKQMIMSAVVALAIPLWAQEPDEFRKPGAEAIRREFAAPGNDDHREHSREKRKEFRERRLEAMESALRKIGVTEEQLERIFQLQEEHAEKMKANWDRTKKARWELSRLQDEGASKSEFDAAIRKIVEAQTEQLKTIVGSRLEMERILGKEKHDRFMDIARELWKEDRRPGIGRGGPPDPRFGDAFGPGFGVDLFGSYSGSGNEFAGTFYDLKQTKEKTPTEVDNDKYLEVIRGFVDSGWNEEQLGNYFQAPRKKYATFFMMPGMKAHEAPKAFGVQGEVEPERWVVHYKGKIAAPETGRYRFCGVGDDVLLVRMGGELVLDACWAPLEGWMSDWHSTDKNSRKFRMEHLTMVIGDWFDLRKGEPVEMEVLLGEQSGNKFCSVLLIEQAGKEYGMDGERPILPIFKTAEISPDLLDEMCIKPDQETAEGPFFAADKTK